MPKWAAAVAVIALVVTYTSATLPRDLTSLIVTCSGGADRAADHCAFAGGGGALLGNRGRLRRRPPLAARPRVRPAVASGSSAVGARSPIAAAFAPSFAPSRASSSASWPLAGARGGDDEGGAAAWDGDDDDDDDDDQHEEEVGGDVPRSRTLDGYRVMVHETRSLHGTSSLGRGDAARDRVL